MLIIYQLPSHLIADRITIFSFCLAIQLPIAIVVCWCVVRVGIPVLSSYLLLCADGLITYTDWGAAILP